MPTQRPSFFTSRQTGRNVSGLNRKEAAGLHASTRTVPPSSTANDEPLRWKCQTRTALKFKLRKVCVSHEIPLLRYWWHSKNLKGCISLPGMAHSLCYILKPKQGTQHLPLSSQSYTTYFDRISLGCFLSGRTLGCAHVVEYQSVPLSPDTCTVFIEQYKYCCSVKLCSCLGTKWNVI